MPHLEELWQIIARWEASLEWIVDGWDCIEEYTHDLMPRYSLHKALEAWPADAPPPQELLAKIEALDQLFKEVTIVLKRCVWPAKPGEYDPETYWFYYRWPHDCPYNI